MPFLALTVESLAGGSHCLVFGLQACAMDGTSHQFRELYAEYRSRLYGFFLKRLGDPDQAQDLVQEVFVRVLRYMHTYDPARGEIGGWLFGIASNTFKTHLARGSAQAEQAVPEYADVVDELRRPPGEEVESEMTGDRILELLDSLPEPERSVLILHRLEEKTLDETAALTGLSRRTVSRKVGNGLNLMRQLLRQQGIRLGSEPHG